MTFLVIRKITVLLLIKGVLDSMKYCHISFNILDTPWWQRLSAPPGQVPTPGSRPSSALLDSPPWCTENAQNRPWIPPETSSLPHSFLDPLSEPHWVRKDPPGVCQDPTLYAEPIGRENACSFLPRKKSTVAACSCGGTTVSQGDERETKREALS